MSSQVSKISTDTKHVVLVYSYQMLKYTEEEEEMGHIRSHLIQQVEGKLSTSADGFPLVEEVVDVSTPLMMQPENWPKGLHLSLSLMRLCFS